MSDKLTLLQSNISKLIDNNYIAEARLLMESYGAICQDSNYFSLLSVILYLEGKKLDAQSVIYEGLTRFPYDSDLYYNLAMIYEEDGFLSWSNISLYFSRIFSTIENDEKTNNCNKNNILILGNSETKLYLSKNFPTLINDYYFIEFKCYENYSSVEQLIVKNTNENDIIFFDDDLMKSEIEDDFYHRIHEFLTLNFSQNLIIKSDINLNLPVEGFKYKLRKALNKPSIKALILGLSYAEVGIIESSISDECVNMALSSQDLFYDLEILKLFLENDEFKIEKVIINLSYYSFMYDLSKTFERERIRRYFPFITKGHNFDKLQLLNLLSYRYSHESEEQIYIKNHNYKMYQRFGEEHIEKGKKYAKFHSKFGSKKIELENMNIFSDFLKLLEKYKVEPLILVCPVTKHYSEHFETSLKDRFYEILNNIEFDLSNKIIDYFDSELFNESDFWDDSHLNYSGASKLTNLIATKINMEAKNERDSFKNC